jgi:FtsH-binding integral membrane protein
MEEKMKSSQSVMDRLAIGLSLICTVHCFATPVILVLLPSLAALQLDYEQFHIWILMAVLPTSLLALNLGCKKHKQFSYMVFGIVGLCLMLLAIFIEHEGAEKALTLTGSTFIAIAHWFNYRQCLKKEDGDCPCSGDTSEQVT